MSKADADIVTLLRLAALNEEIRENDMAGDDDTFNDGFLSEQSREKSYDHITFKFATFCIVSYCRV